MDESQFRLPVEVNGYPIIAAAQANTEGRPDFLVVADRGKNIVDQYVSWRVYWSTEENRWSAYSGQYCRTRAAAMHDFVTRLGLYQGMQQVIDLKNEKIKKLTDELNDARGSE